MSALFAFDAITAYCGSFASLNPNDWISISILVVLASITIAALLYALSGVFPTERREKLKSIVKYEMGSAVISLVIIAALIMMTNFTCSLGGLVSESIPALNTSNNNYAGIYSFDLNYVGTLLFSSGTQIVADLYTTALQLTAQSNLLDSAVISAQQVLNSLPGGGVAEFIGGLPFPEISKIFSIFNDILYGWGDAFIVVGNGVLFIVFFLLIIFESISLTVLVPVALAMRSLAFTGPRLRSASNAFLALGIGMYFVFPLTIASNSYIANCLNLNAFVPSLSGGPPSSSQTVGCIGLSKAEYKGISPYLPSISIPTSSLFESGGSLDFLTNFWSSATFAGNIPVVGIIFNLANAYNTINSYANTIAAYMLLSVILISLDLAITIGFSVGLARGLDSLADIMGGEKFW